MPLTEEEEDEVVNTNSRRMLFLLAVLKKKKQKFREKLDEEGRKRRDRNIPRTALNSPTNSAWQKLYESGDDGALITVTGYDHTTFQFILNLFNPFFVGHTP